MRIKNGIKSVNELVENSNIDRKERKKKIISIYNEIKKKKILNDEVEVETKIDFMFNKEIISSFLSDLCDVSDTQKHHIPIIDEIEIKDITPTTANIEFNASLS
eukprot:275643_1